MNYFRTGKDDIDRELDAFIKLARLFFGDNIVAIYLMGSYIDDSAVETSDLDIGVVYKKERAERIMEISDFFTAHSRDLFRKEIDLYLISLDQIEKLNPDDLLTREGIMSMKIASRLLYGTDVSHKIVLPDFDSYLAITLKTPFYFMNRVRGIVPEDTIPTALEFPDTHDYYYGYLAFTQRTNRNLESKPVLSLIGWISTALIAMQAKQYVGKKSDVCRAHELHINNEWTPYVRDAYQLIRTELNYRMPHDEHTRAAMRTICSKLLDFERYYMQAYKEHVND